MSVAKEYIAIGAVARAQGLKGEIQVLPLTDEPVQFEELTIVFLSMGGSRKAHHVEKVRAAKNRFILKLEGIDDRTASELLKGALIERPIEELAPLAEDEYFIFDLLGLTVKTNDGQNLGKLVDVLDLPANDVYVVSSGTKEILIPAIKDVILKIDFANKEMIINPMDGLLD